MKTALRLVVLLVAWAALGRTTAWGQASVISKSGLEFTGSKGTYLELTRPITNDFTIEYWVKTSTAGSTGTQWYSGSGLVDGEVGGTTTDFGTSLLGNKIAFGVGQPDVTIQSTTSVNDGQWHHVAVTRVQSSGLMTLYIDGAREASSTGTTSTAALTAPAVLRIGSLQTKINYFTGQLDEIRFWNVARTAAEITANYRRQVATTETSLVAYYRFDEGTGTTTTDTKRGTTGQIGFPATAANRPDWVAASGAPIYGDPTITSFTPASGSTQTTITLTGTNLSAATRVTVGGREASFTVLSDTQLSLVVAAGTTSGRIAVTTPAGTATSATNFTVVPAPTGCGVSYFDNTNSYSGLTAEYYAGYFNDNLGFFASNPAKLTRVDPDVNFATSTFGPLVSSGVTTSGTDANPDQFSARYRGSIYISTAGTYTFDLVSDDASYMWIDGDALLETPVRADAIVDNGGAHGAQTATVKKAVQLSAGLHNILIFYGEANGGNSIVLRYASGPGVTANSIVPGSVLCAGKSNLPPVAQSVTNTTTIPRNAAQRFITALNATDADGSIASYKLVSVPTSGTLYYQDANSTYVAAAAGQTLTVAQAGSLRFKPDGTTVGNVTFAFTATDNGGMEANVAAVYTIPVSDVVVTANNDSYEVPRNTAVTGNVLLNDNDPNNSTLTATRLTDPAHGTVVVSNNGTYTYTPAADYLGPDSFTYQIRNTAGQTATATVSLRVYDTGSACTSSTGPNLLTNFDFSQGNVGFSNDYNYISPATNATYTGNTKGLNPEGNYAVDVNANTYHGAFRSYDYDNTNADGTAKSTTPAEASKFLMINGAASIQRMYSQTVMVQKNRYYTFSAYFNNLLPPGSNNAVPEVGFVINGASVSGTLVLNESPDRWVKYASVWYSGDNTTAVFEIRNVSTAAGGNDLGIDQLYFGTCNLPPVANNDLQTTLPGRAVTFSATANDADGDGGINAATMSLNPGSATRQTSFTVAGKGTFAVDNSGNVTFTPVAGFTGTVSIPYTVQDVDGALSNPGTLSVTVQSPPTDLATSISASAASVTAGQPLTYTVTARNNGPGIATKVAETLQLPAGMGTANVTFSNGGAYDNTTGLVTFPQLATLSVGGSTDYGVTIKTPGAGPITATAGITAENTDADLSNNAARVSTIINPLYDLLTTITGPTSVAAGNLATYTVTTSNSAASGALSAAPNVRQTVALPKNLTDVYVSNGGTYDAASGIVAFPVLASLPLGQAAVHTISFPAPTTGFTAAAAVAGNYTAPGAGNNAGDVNTANNTQSAAATAITPATGTPATATASQTGSVANLATTIATSTPSVAPGASVVLTVNLINNGPSAAANVVEQVSLLPGLTVTGLPANASYNPNTGVVTFGAIGSLASAASQSYSFRFVAPATGYVLAAASVSSATTDPVAADNVAATKVMVTPTTDVTTALNGPASTLAGQMVSYTVATANASETPASGVVQTVRLPAGLTDVISTGGGTYDAATGVVTFSLGTLPGNSRLVNSVSFSAPSAGAYSPTASVSTTTAESSTTNNQAAVATKVQPSNDVAIRVNGPATTPVFGAATYQVVTTNNGPNVAESVVPTLQLPAGLTIITLPIGATYTSSTGLMTFETLGNLASGASSVSSLTVRMPEVAQLTGLAQAAVGGTVADRNLDNNRASFTTASSRESDKTADLRVTLAASVNTVAAGKPVTLTATFASALNNQDPATNVVTQLSLPIGLTGVTVSNSGTYNSETGLVTWPVLNSLASAANASFTYTVQLNAPGVAALAASASIASDIADSNPGNNAASVSVAITAQADVTTLVSGPEAVVPGSAVTYSVVTLNNGPSAAANVVQTVTLPAGVVATGITNGSQSGSVITFNTLASQAAGAAGAVTNTFTITAPAAAYSVQGRVTTSSTDSNAGNNQVNTNTAVLNLAPYAQNVVNTLQAPVGSTAGQMLLSPLAAADAETAAASLSYAIDPASLPAAAQGVVYYSNGAAYVALPTTGAAIALTAAQAASLRFAPAASFAGNAFFTYTATDGAGNVSNTALYTVAVGRDINAYAKATPTKGGSNPYQNNDVLTYLIDPDGARYVAAGTSALVYDATTGALLTGASNGLPATGTNVVMNNAAGSLAPEQLTALGVRLDATTGQLLVADRTKLRTGTYTVSLTTTDVNGGTNAQLVSFTIGGSPLPVELVSFTAQAVGRTAVLRWRTATEKDNDHFVVERSLDGQRFEAVGQVAGQGSSSQAHAYELVDARVPAAGTVYYRLRQVDRDGTETLSLVQTVQFAGEAAAAAPGLYPNPATTSTTLDLHALPAGAYQVSVVDMAGRTVATYQVHGGIESTLDLAQLPMGTYAVLVQGAAGRHVLRLVKR